MLTIVTAETQEFIDALFGPQQHAHHMQADHWHMVMVGMNPDYIDEIAQRQADKRAAGIGINGRCPA